ncbi:transcription factor grauzone-like isoform X2 [Lutzomyia longipalpis]|uniref:transcription factor grauzone-like isoform X2 n=1 Tax=Lutzomyia longipalpis TaxID=7200 RepID=UPI0024834682|nr:transcription factor grauzone-like isoform X2 [Lutzomyia longipalpis]
MDPLEIDFNIKEEVFPEMEVICRLCAEKSSTYSSIFNENLHESLFQNFGVSIDPADNWPKSVCQHCKDTANVCLDFLETIWKAMMTHHELHGDLAVTSVVKSDTEITDEEDLHENFQVDDDVLHSGDAEDTEISEIPPKSSKRKKPKEAPETYTTAGCETMARRSERILQKRQRIQPKPPDDVVESAEPEAAEEKDSEDTKTTIKDRSERLAKRRSLKDNMQDEEENEVEINRRNPEDLAEEDEKIRIFFQLQCSTCEESFEKLQELSNHSRRVHKKEAYLVCCEKKLNTREKIVNHLNYHTNPDAFKCKECNRSFLNAQRLNNHTLNTHTPKEQHPYKCEECSKTFMQRKNYNSHLLQHISDDEERFRCKTCKRIFPTKNSLRMHIQGGHELGHKDAVERLICDICGKGIKGRHQYKIHVDSHKKGVGDFSCPICEKKFKQKRLMVDHHARHNVEGKIYKCDICGKISPNERALKNHIKLVHLQERLHQCTLCDRAFKVKVALREHMAAHSGNAILYKCLFCERQFNSGANMYAHQKQKHPLHT